MNIEINSISFSHEIVYLLQAFLKYFYSLILSKRTFRNTEIFKGFKNLAIKLGRVTLFSIGKVILFKGKNVHKPGAQDTEAD